MSHATGLEVDHVFVAVSQGGAEADAIVEAGFSEGAANEHPGQGTACRRIFFENAYLELIWLENLAEASSPPIDRTKLAARTRLDRPASRIGICLRRLVGAADGLPFESWEYRPPYLPAGMSIPMAANSALEHEPLIFVLPVSATGGPGPSHENGARGMTSIRLSLPGVKDWSRELDWLAGSGCVELSSADAEELTIELDHRRQGGELVIGTDTLIRMLW